MRRFAVVVAVVLPAAVGMTMSCAPAVSDGSSSGGRAASSTGGLRAGSGGSSSSGSGGVASGGQIGSAGSGSGGNDPQSTGGTNGTASGGNGNGASGGAGAPGSGGRATGGSVVTGATGGRGTGGASNGSGGIAATGGRGTGGASSGGSGPTACNVPNHTGSGSFTFYFFGQGTARDGSGYRTACGYYGTESGTTDTIQNIASMSPAAATYFAAIPGTSGFNTSSHCGSCVQITGQNGRVIIATVADECPYGSDGGNTICGGNPAGHLDLSKAAFDQLGYSRGDPTGTTWKFVPCPVTGNVVVRLKPGNPNELFVENSILAITGVQGASRTSYGAWHFGSNLASGQSLQLTDALGRTLTIQLSSTTAGANQDTGTQFPACQ